MWLHDQAVAPVKALMVWEKCVSGASKGGDQHHNRDRRVSLITNKERDQVIAVVG